jgi:hypothetical protein
VDHHVEGFQGFLSLGFLVFGVEARPLLILVASATIL